MTEERCSSPPDGRGSMRALSGDLESCDDRGRDRHTLHFDGIIRLAARPDPRLAAFHGEFAADRDEVRHFETRAAKFAHFGGNVRHVVEFGRLEKARLGADQGNSDDAEGRCQLLRLHPERLLEQPPGAPVEILEKTAVEHDACRVAMTPFDRELPAIDEIGHARGGFSYW